MQTTDQVFVWLVCKLPTRPPPEPYTLLLQVPTITHSLGSPSLRNGASEPVILTDVVRCIKTSWGSFVGYRCVSHPRNPRIPATLLQRLLFNPACQAVYVPHCPRPHTNPLPKNNSNHQKKSFLYYFFKSQGSSASHLNAHLFFVLKRSPEMVASDQEVQRGYLPTLTPTPSLCSRVLRLQVPRAALGTLNSPWT